MKRKAIFLDRDGVLNKAIIKNGLPFPPATLEELVLPREGKHALAKLKSAGFLLIGATNQPDVARGLTSISLVEEINKKLLFFYNLDDIRVCYHDNSDNCTCRKPLPGLLTAAAEDYHINLFQSFMIGDRWKDIEAGSNAGCKTIFMRNEYNEKKSSIPPNFIADSLLEAAEWILNENHRESLPHEKLSTFEY